MAWLCGGVWRWGLGAQGWWEAGQQGATTGGVPAQSVGEGEQNGPQFIRAGPAGADRVTVPWWLARPGETCFRPPCASGDIRANFKNSAALTGGMPCPRWIGDEVPQLFEPCRDVQFRNRLQGRVQTLGVRVQSRDEIWRDIPPDEGNPGGLCGEDGA